MKALVLEQARNLVEREISLPELPSDHTLVSVVAAGIGGSEYQGFNHPGIRSLPSIMGHGIVGMIEGGERVAIYPLSGCGGCTYCLAGQTSLCDQWSLIGVQTDGGFAEYVSAPTNSLVPLPDGLSWEQAIFIEPFANSINAWEISEATANSSVAIVGAGGLGLGLVACAKAMGCKNITVIESSLSRQAAARSLGATSVISQVADEPQEESNAQGVAPLLRSTSLYDAFDVVFDTVGSEATRSMAIAITKKNAICVFLGFSSPMFELNMSELIRHQKIVKGSFAFSRQQFESALHLVVHCESAWVNNVSMDDVEPVLLNFLAGDFSLVKAALRHR
ncbi:zinc-dependent alcohol dehydrogenase [Eionea flava]